MNIAIIGFGLQGQSAYRYWDSPENSITIVDSNSNVDVPSGSNLQTGEDYLKNLDQFDLIVRSPSILPDEIIKNNSLDITEKITSSTNEFFKVCPTKNIIGVTGTKGKGTTSTLLAKMLKKTGQKVHLGGNIGTPPLELLENEIGPNDWVVLELANFQLIDLKYSPHIAACLMIAPEHLDWHETEEEYYASKKQLFAYQSTEDFAIYFAENNISKEIASRGNGKKIPYFAKPGAIIENDSLVIDEKTICSTQEFKLLGKHNWQNICAAATAFWQISNDLSAIKEVVTKFNGMPYRLELIRELNGVKYYNDSFGTTPETAIVAIESFTRPVNIILGGSNKGSDYKKLAETVKSQKVKNVVLIGKMAQTIQKELDNIRYKNYVLSAAMDMSEIVQTVKGLSESGDIVLLSPACASFDMFENYKDRGDKFSQAVQALS